jgi:glycosyltransferase involved in cell wall biosynthesis
VERNTIEVIRALREKFYFIVVTSERLSPDQGSLHWQLYDLKVPVVDLAEIADTEHHLKILTVLSQIIPPDLIWICNGSPWLVEHATHLRRLFANLPIVDQQVYDTKEGWIQHYDKKGIQSFDHFIAINKKIYKTFTSRIKIPHHRVSMIYHCLNEESINRARSVVGTRETARRNLGISAAFDKIFIFVGRLTEQKQPLSFLEIARHAQTAHPSTCFLMVGNGELAGDCDRFIRRNGLHNIRWIPYHPQPPELMAIADGMIITSIYEGLPIAMLEALAVGIPVLTTDVGDIRLILEEYGAGLVSDTKNEENKLIIQKELWEKFLKIKPALTKAALSSSAKVLERFATDTISGHYKQLFDLLLTTDRK